MQKGPHSPTEPHRPIDPENRSELFLAQTMQQTAELPVCSLTFQIPLPYIYERSFKQSSFMTYNGIPQ